VKRFVLSLCLLSMLANFGYGQNADSFVSIHEAAAAGNARGIVAFLQKGVSVDSKDSSGKTPLMAASESGMSRVIPLLLLQHAGINMLDEQGNTALHYGVAKKHAKVVSELLSNSANAEIRNSKGQTAKDLAEASGDVRLANLFPKEMTYDQPFQSGNSNVMTGPETIYAILEDVNGIRARLSTDPNLESQLTTMFKSLELQEAKWTSRQRRIATSFYSALRKEVDIEIVFIQSVAKGEDANDIVHQLDVVQSTWKSIFSKSSRKMREATRGTTSQGMQTMTRSSRGRSRRGQTNDTSTARRGSRAREEETVQEIDPHASYVDSWGSISDTNLDTLYGETQDKFFGDMSHIRSLAEKQGKTRTLNAIDGVMLERQFRGERSLVVYSLTKEELSNVQDMSSAEGNTRGRRTRGRSSQTQQTTRRRR
jgi:hypothetical protein